jgi:Na+/H+-dicarboxylate symporter
VAHGPPDRVTPARYRIGLVLFLIPVLFGDYCTPLQIIGDAFIKLLQITILPYIIVSLTLGIGGLTLDQAKLTANKAGILLLLFWGFFFAMVLGFPFAFPKWESAAADFNTIKTSRASVTQRP